MKDNALKSEEVKTVRSVCGDLCIRINCLKGAF